MNETDSGAMDPDGAEPQPPAMPAHQEFVNPDEVPAADVPAEPVESFDELASAGLVATKPPGPGLPESVGWCLGVTAFQVGFGIVGAVIAAVLLVIAAGGSEPPQESVRKLNELEGTPLLLMTGVPNIFAFAGLIGLALLRLGKGRLRKLNFARPSVTQTLVLCSAILPVGYVADLLWNQADYVWQELTQDIEWIDEFNKSTNIMEFMSKLEGVPLLLLLLCFAVTPAVGEEFILRGLVGRGLVARWGVVWGVFWTSLLFAMLHMYPVHVAAVFPMGIMMHIIYLTTRTLWAPILFHFLNNSLASIYTYAGQTGEESSAPWWLALIGFAYAIGTSCVLWRYRTRYLDETGREFDPGYHSVEAPPAESPYRRTARESLLVGSLAGVLLLGQVAFIAYGFFAPTPAEGAEQVDPVSDVGRPSKAVPQAAALEAQS